MLRRDFLRVGFSTAAYGTFSFNTAQPVTALTRKASVYLYPQTRSKTSPRCLRGVNVAGAEFGACSAENPGRLGQDYFYPSPKYLRFLAAQGHEVIRLPVRWERLQHDRSRGLLAQGVRELRGGLRAASAAGLLVIIDLHNYGRFRESPSREVLLGREIGRDEFANFWSRLTHAFRREDNIYGWGLMNEPHGLGRAAIRTGFSRNVTVWQDFSRHVVEAIRSEGDSRKILIAGDDFSGTQSWTTINKDPWVADNVEGVLYEAHHYFDDGHTGFYSDTFSKLTTASQRQGWRSVREKSSTYLKEYLNWLKRYHVSGFIGELGWPNTPGFNSVGASVYRQLHQHRCGSTQWAAGEYWDSKYKLALYNPHSSPYS